MKDGCPWFLRSDSLILRDPENEDGLPPGCYPQNAS